MRTLGNGMAFGFLASSILFLTGCTPGGGAGTALLNQTTECIPQVDAAGNLVACTVSLAFNPTSASQTITVSVRANLTDSRPAFTVTDINNNVVATVQSPTVNDPSATFTSSNTTVHSVFVSELVNPNSDYTVTVTGF